MTRRLGFVFFLFVGTTSGSLLSLANDLEHAPPAFEYLDSQAVPIDIDTIHIDLVFDYASRLARGEATVTFVTNQDGFPFMDIVPDPTNIELNGERVPASEFPTINDPHNVTQFRVLQRPVTAGTMNTLTFTYNLSADDVTFSDDAVRSGFFMSDLTTGGRSYFEQYGPSNYEHDRFTLTMDVRVTGVTREHTVYTNATSTVSGDNQWNLVFPSFFTTSAIYFHLTEAGRFVERTATYSGMERQIPILVYASSISLADDGLSQSLDLMRELEGTYGPSLHERIVVYVTSVVGGGMEYGGATMTSLRALGHEITHFWFARGVMPSEGNSGWIDEAIASWRDNGYSRASGAPDRAPTNLGGFSPYRRHTPIAAYSRGAQLISELDYLFQSQGGMRALLKDLFGERAGTTITTPFFQNFLESATGMDLTTIFSRYVLGQSSDQSGIRTIAPEPLATFGKSLHPRPYTTEELALYR